MSHLDPSQHRRRRLNLLSETARDLRFERSRGDEPAARTPGGERGQQRALKQRFDALAASLAADV